jgi:hypothetical protein
MTAIHRTSVVLKTKSPIEETAEPENSRAKLPLMRNPDFADEGVLVGGEVGGTAGSMKWSFLDLLSSRLPA